MGWAEFFGALVIVLAALMIGWQTFAQYREVESQAIALLQQLGRTGEAQIVGGLRNVDGLLRDIAERTRPQALDDGASRFLTAQIHAYPEIRHVFVTDAAGVITLSTMHGVLGFNASLRPYFLLPKHHLDTDRMFLTGPTTAITGATLFLASRAIRNPDGAFAGVVGVSLNPAFFDAVLEAIVPDGRSLAGVLNLEGDFLSRMPDPSRFRHLSMADAPAFQRHRQMAVPVTVQNFSAGSDGSAYMGVLRTMADFPLVIGVARDRRDILDALKPTLAMHAAFLLLIVVLTLCSVAVARSVRRHQSGHHARVEASRNYFNRLIETANTLIVGLDEAGRVVLCNSMTEQVTGLARGELLGRKWSDTVVPPDLYPEAWAMFERGLVAETDHDQFEAPIRRHPAGERIVSWSNSRIADPDDRLVSIWFGIDVTHRQRVQAELKAANAQLLRTIETLESRNREVTLLRNMADRLQSCRDAAEAFAAAAECVQALLPGRAGGFYGLADGQPALALAVAWPGTVAMAPTIDPWHCGAAFHGCPHRWDGNRPESTCAHFGEAYAGSGLCVPLMAHGEVQGMLILRDAEEQSLEVPCEPVATGSRSEDAGVATAVCENLGLALATLRLRHQLQEQAARDPLTGLYNRRIMSEMFERELAVAKRKQRPVAVMMIDIDHFKRFNDRHGHEAGDAVLKAVADSFARQCRSSDIVCRHGGEEFAVLLPESDLPGALQRAEGLREQTRRLRVTNRGETLDPVTISIGVAAFPDHGVEVAALLHAADEALYRSKILGRDRVCVADQQTRGLFKSLAWNDRVDPPAAPRNPAV